MERGGFRIRRKCLKDKWEKQLIRKGVKLYGTRWCTMCGKQKAVLSNVCSSWERFYIDCDSLRNVLESSTVNKIPSWRVAGKWYIGAQSETSLKQLVESTGQGMQRWDVAEFTRRHRRRGKWAEEEFAEFVKRSILKARATPAAPTLASAPAAPPTGATSVTYSVGVLHGPMAKNNPEPAAGWNDKKGFTAHNAARSLIIVALSAATFTQENFQKLLQATTSDGSPFKLQKSSPFNLNSTRATSTDSYDDKKASFKKEEQKLAAGAGALELETFELAACEDEKTTGQTQHKRASDSVGRFSRSERVGAKQPRLMARQQLREESAAAEETYMKRPDVVVQKKATNLHELRRFQEASGMKLRKSLSTILEILNGVGVRLTGLTLPKR